MGVAIECKGLVKTYRGRPPVEAVRGIDFSVKEGECFGVLGPNGAGKTTTIEVLEGLLPATQGEIEIFGMRWSSHADDIRQSIGISLQETRLPDKLTVLEILTLFRSFYQRGLEPEEAMRRVSLNEKSSAWVKNLSGGQRQRLAVAGALVGDPRLLFLDEPTTGLDPQSRRQLWDVIAQFKTEGRTVLLTTHYMDEAERLCDRVAIVDHGKIIALDSPRELINGLAGANLVEFALTSDESNPLPEPNAWSDLPEVRGATMNDGYYRLSTQKPHVVIPGLLDRIVERRLTLAELTTRQASLEDVFLNLTGRHLDEEQAAR